MSSGLEEPQPRPAEGSRRGSGGSGARAYLGLARAAGRLALGHWQCRQAMGRGAVVLLVVAQDASDGTRRRLVESARRAGARCVVWGTQQELGEATGTTPKAVVGFLDSGLAAGFLRAVGAGAGRRRGRRRSRSDDR